MNRFFSPSSNISADKIIIGDKDQAHHIKNVLKLKPGEKAVVFDENSNEYNCVICELKDKVRLDIKNKIPVSGNDEEIKLTIACAIPKKAKFDDIVDKLTQLGVEAIIPLDTERVVVRLDKDKVQLRLARWKKIALSAAKQSQRRNVPAVKPLATMKEVLEGPEKYDLKLIPTLSGGRKRLKDVFRQIKPKNILVFIGPEGDFTGAEVALAKEAGCVPVSLGDLVLRVDTAAIAVASFIRQAYTY